MAYCALCNREVGIDKQRPWLSTLLLVILGLIVPLWPITLPLFWGLAILNMLIRTKSGCGVCKSKKISRSAPVSTAEQVKKAA